MIFLDGMIIHMDIGIEYILQIQEINIYMHSGEQKNIHYIYILRKEK